MSSKMEMTIKIINEDGEKIEKTISREIPHLKEFEEEGFRTAFGDIETAVLESRKTISEEAIETYMEEMSKKKIGEGEIEAKNYGIESEMGKINTKSHKKVENGKTENTEGTLYPKLKPLENYRSIRYDELQLKFMSELSARKTAEFLNRIRLEYNGSKATTVRNQAEKAGEKIEEYVSNLTGVTLYENGFSLDGKPTEEEKYKSDNREYMDMSTIATAAAESEITSPIYLKDYENPEQSINLSIDDVCSKAQKPNRPMSEKAKSAKKINNTVIHIENESGKYIVNSSKIKEALRIALCFLLYNGVLSGKQLVFFTDGARILHDAIRDMFDFMGVNYKIILDWYHLHKKLKEELSRALNNTNIRNETVDIIKPFLWLGDVDAAISALRNISSQYIKAPEKIDEFIGYLNRVRDYIPCYELRKNLGLRNSSNLGEKANDLVVSSRQKHNGMSWSKDGSSALASVCAANANSEIDTWVRDASLRFKFVQKSA